MGEEYSLVLYCTWAQTSWPLERCMVPREASFHVRFYYKIGKIVTTRTKRPLRKKNSWKISRKGSVFFLRCPQQSRLRTLRNTSLGSDLESTNLPIMPINSGLIIS